jgi:hypothetical protein
MRKLKQNLLTITIILFALPLWAAEFTADSVVVIAGQSKQSVFYVVPGKWRMNENATEGKRAAIFRGDDKTITILWPDKKLYLIQPVPPQQYKMLADLKPGEEIKRAEIGRETVSGYATTKYRVNYVLEGKQFTVIEWYSKDLGVVLKSEAEDNAHTAQLTNIKKIKLDKKIFEVPSDYRPATQSDLAEINRQSPAN